MPEGAMGEDHQGRMNRRAALGAGTAALGGAAVGGALTAHLSRADTRTELPATGEINANLNSAPHLIKLAATEPQQFDGGTLRGATEDNFPVLSGQNGAVYLAHLEVGGIREPHWHPTAWELNFVISGTAKWTILGTHPDDSYRNDVFEAEQGDLVFAPQGFFHYFENARTDMPLDVLIIFNTSAREGSDDIGIKAALSSVPRDVLAATLGIPASALKAIPTDITPVVITRRH
ncbi:cupin domain-containing protein [Nocardia sp. 2YAB30]|uniref:cupin domain-containing protein n=1 Tax=unclassified Nocardia TaxID=2637762 RepID=UPI003F9C3DDF